MVAKDRPSSHTLPQAQHRQRIRTAIDEIPHAPQLILTGLKADRLQEPLELAGATLNVPYNPPHDNLGPRLRGVQDGQGSVRGQVRGQVLTITFFILRRATS